MDTETRLERIMAQHEAKIRRWECVKCGGKALRFRSFDAWEDYQVSGLCEKCQERAGFDLHDC